MRVNHTGSLFRLGNGRGSSSTLFNSEAKLAKLKRSLESLILDGYATYRELARLAGFVISLSLAVGPIAGLFTRQMYIFIQSRGLFLESPENVSGPKSLFVKLPTACF